MPTPLKPRALKLITGSRRLAKSAAGACFAPLTAVPPAPDWLPNSHAVKEWKRLAQILVANKLLTEAGLSAFGMLCSLHGKLVQLWSAGETPVASMVSQYRNLINDFGVTPIAQGKVKPAGEESPKNRFSQNGQPTA